ncbi:disease resistance protein RGA5-like [Triticum dicoccoides]|uniref:Leaf rust resistance protein Lr10 n=1 Tax=Triticum dicoccoides TaxID=85692 RepID=E0XMI8_TRIDC|nr:disease resistance protein RGA5-like [Triticum dicoccoides]XP_037481002.1 disease resistance protein RGA5-like [Triticum dicoccoides]ADM65833.1 leaf rust resistance protein Lr10 [Triticum dicoccoides]ADM65835.1 leaf rust resistance protein Lr10 [Triticum dicoccoides]
MAQYLVSASTGAVGSLLTELGTILDDEYILLAGVGRDIEFVIHRVRHMWQSFLLKVAHTEEPGQHDKSCADFMRELSYDIEDKIDNSMSLILHHACPKSGIKKHMIKFNNLLPVKNRHQIAKDIRDIKSQILEAHDRCERYCRVEDVCPARTEFVDPRLCTVDTCAADLVGIDGPKYELVKWLRNGEDEQKVVSIVGCAGLGKTTLAKQVYDELRINFEYRAFVSISRSPDMAAILKCVLSQFHAQDYSSDESEIPKLVDQIRDLLQDKRYFVIIDDIWDMKTWDVLKCALCKNSCGSVIMTTTRIYDVAKSCCSSNGDLVYNIQPLSVADSEKLFLNRVFGHEKGVPPELKEVSKDVLKKCGGLPLAINAISILLAAEENKEEWGHVGLSSVFAERHKKPDIDAMKYILSLSYFDLPPHLRSCLLYLAMFPEDCLIEKERLVHRWISEGFIRYQDGEDLVQVGERYLYELVNRSLIESVGVPYDGKARFYRVHNVILDFLMIKSMEENFCTLTSNQSRLDYKVRRLSLFANKDPSCIAQLDLSHARSLGASGHLGQLISSVKSNALRVLDVQDCSELGNHHVKDIGRNPLLRYLNISGTDVTELPIQIGDMGFLETLDASFTELVEMPGSITRLRQLQRLFVSDETKLPDEIGNMCLQELGDINAFSQSVNFLNELGKLMDLRKLSIIWDTNGILRFGKRSYKEKKLVSSLCKLDQVSLRTLCVTFYLREKDGFIGHPFLPALNSIREVYLRRGRMCWINKWLLSLANLEKLHISGGDEIEQDDLRTVGSIPTLVEFKLYSGCLGPIIISSGFEQLERLELKFSFSQLTFEVGAMPNLKKLDLHVYLSKFKSAGAGFDFGIQHLSSLACVSIVIFCEGVSAAYVEAAEGAFKSMVNAHPNPNRPMLEMTRESADFMSQDE